MINRNPNQSTTDKLRKPLLVLLVSTAGLIGISKHEGFKSDAYIPVPGDVPTIGYGSTQHINGSPVKLGDKITRQQADEYLKHDLNKFHKAMVNCIKVPVSQNEYDAFISLTYNIGPTAFCKSTLVTKLNNYDYEGACKQILRWDKFGNPPKPLKGLTKRRQEEYNICIS